MTGALVEPPPGASLAVSLDRRRSSAGDTLLVFNESWEPTTARLRFTQAGSTLTRWDPRTGFHTTLRDAVQAGDIVAVELDAAQSLIVTLASPG